MKKLLSKVIYVISWQFAGAERDLYKLHWTYAKNNQNFYCGKCSLMKAFCVLESTSLDQAPQWGKRQKRGQIEKKKLASEAVEGIL